MEVEGLRCRYLSRWYVAGFLNEESDMVAAVCKPVVVQMWWWCRRRARRGDGNGLLLRRRVKVAKTQTAVSQPPRQLDDLTTWFDTRYPCTTAGPCICVGLRLV